MPGEASMDFIDPLVFDTSVIFNIGHRGDLSQVINRLAEQHRLLVPPGVVEETQRSPEYRQFYHELLHLNFERQAGKIPILHADAITQLATRLGGGELDVIILALETGGTVVIDERIARREAIALNIPVTGTFGLLKYAVAKLWLREQEALIKIEMLRTNKFRIPPVLQGQSFADYLTALGE